MIYCFQIVDMIRFFRQYIEQDSVGVVATAHLVAADQHGIESDICMSIAEKQTLAVDFPKTGRPPDRLEENEKIKKYPDFLNKNGMFTYRSKSLLGQLHRKIKVACVVLFYTNHAGAVLNLMLSFLRKLKISST